MSDSPTGQDVYGSMVTLTTRFQSRKSRIPLGHYLIRAREDEALLQLLSHPLYFNYLIKRCDPDGNNLLHYAIIKRNYALIKAIIDFPHFDMALLATANRISVNCLKLAFNNADDELARLLLKKLSPDRVLKKKLIKRLKHPSQYNDNTFTQLIREGKSNKASLLLEEGWVKQHHLRHRDGDGNNALILTILFGERRLLKSMLASKHCDETLMMEKNHLGESAWSIVNKTGSDIAKAMMAQARSETPSKPIKNYLKSVLFFCSERNPHHQELKPIGRVFLNLRID